MSEVLYDRLKENLESLKMRNTLEILDNYLERAIKDDFNIVDVLPKKPAASVREPTRNRFKRPAFPLKKVWRTSTFLFNHQLTNDRLMNLPPCVSWRTPRTSYS